MLCSLPLCVSAAKLLLKALTAQMARATTHLCQGLGNLKMFQALNTSDAGYAHLRLSLEEVVSPAQC